VFFFTATILIVADQFSKLWVRRNLSPGQPLPEERVVRLTYVANSGGVFGVPLPHPLIFSVIAVIVVLLLCFRYPIFNHLPSKIALGLLLGGTVGNLVDRLRFGYAIDFIDFRLWGDFHWPTFNLADCAIVSGVILLAVFLLSQGEHLRQS
jgi:signal peptidase II